MTLNPEEIRAQIQKVTAAIEKDGFVPNPDGKRLQEHIYYLRLGVLDGLNMALNEEQYEDIPDLEEF